MASTIVLAAGGTGGHIFPAEAIACALVKKGHKVIFITDKAGRKFDRLPSSVQVMVIPMYRRNNSILGMIKFGWGVLNSIYHIYRGFRSIKPNLVVGFGGYPSFPSVLVAQTTGIPTIIHEQNAVLGQVNRILSKYARHIALSFESTSRIRKGVITSTIGTPVRDAFYMYRETEYKVFDKKDPIRLLITGGSQGAKVFSSIVPEAISKLAPIMRSRFSIVHQCPKTDVESLKHYYAEHNISAIVTDFIENMAEEISKAHLVIARAGASTLAELAIIGRPAILIPFPAAKDDHQWFNAQGIEKAKAGWCVRQHQFTVDYVVHQLESMIENPNTLSETAINMKMLGHPQATEHMVNLIETQLNKDK